MIVKDIFGEETEIIDFHSDNIPLLDYTYYPKLIPSATRKQLLEDAAREEKSELQMILKIVFKHYEGVIDD